VLRCGCVCFVCAVDLVYAARCGLCGQNTHIRMRGVHSSVSGRRNSGTFLDGQANTTGACGPRVCGGGRGSAHRHGEPVSAGGAPTDTVGACVEFPAGHGSYGACPERTDAKQSLHVTTAPNETDSMGKRGVGFGGGQPTSNRS